MKDRKLLGSKWNGHDTAQDESFLQNLHRIHKDKISDLKSKIHKCHVEKERLIKEITELEIERESSVKSREFMDLAMNRAKDTAQWILNYTDAEALRIVEVSKQKIIQYEGKVAAIQQQLDHTKEHIDLLAKDIQKLFTEADSGRGEFTRSDEPVDPEGDDRPHEDEEQAYLSGEQQIMVTEPGSDPGNPLLELEELYRSLETGTQAYDQDMPGNAVDNIVEQAQGFWETIAESSEAEKADFSGIEKEADWPFKLHVLHPDSSTDENETQKRSYAGKETSTSADINVPAEQKPQDIEAKSPGVSGQISYIRQKYLVGKLAGEDLMDRDGNIIISKRQVITPDVIIKADKAGKLADLIVHLTLPETGE